MTHRSLHPLLQSLVRVAAATCVLALCAALPANAQVVTARPQARITAPIDDASRVTLAGSRPPRALPSDDIGAVPATLQLHGISLVFSLSAAQQSALDALVAAQQNPSSPLYHRWITPDQYAAQFGAAPSDISAAETWLEQQGFSVDSVSRSHTRIFFSGTAAQVAASFGAPLHYYLSPGTAVAPAATHFAPSADLSLPAALSSSVLAVGNLSSFHPRPRLAVRPAPIANFTSNQTGNHYLTPGDLATIYDIAPAYNSGYTGSNQAIAVVGQSLVSLADITNFQNAVGIAAKTPILTLVPGSGSSQINADGDEAESDLDLEYASTIAKGAQVYFVYTGNNSNYGVFSALEYAIDQDLAPVISTSYGDCEPSLGQSAYNQYNAYLQQAAAQGQTVVAAAGDNGSTDCYGQFSSAASNEQLAVDYPASSQYVTAMGGTEFPSADVASGNNTYFDAESTSDIISSARSYIPEMVWNDDAAAAANSCPGTKANPCQPISAGGGGVSIFTAQPSWQSGTVGGVAISTAGGKRMVPDIALTASPFDAPFAFCTSDKTFWSTGQTSSCTDGLRDSSASGVLTVGGGTSFEAPTFAALVAIINQKIGSTGQGVVNSTLYSLAASPVYATAFHDITSGGNQCASGSSYCSSPGTTDYAASTGYDEASGLGSLDFYNLLSAWPSSTAPSLLDTSTTLTAATNSPATGASDRITITVASLTTTSSVPSGTISLSVDAGTPTTLTLTNGVATYSFSSTTAGTHVLTAVYSGNTTFAASSGSLSLNVVAPVPASFTVSLSPSSATVAPGSSTTGTITIIPANGYTGTVNLTETSSPALTNGCVTLIPSTVSITGTTAGTSTYAIYTSPVPCPATGAARPGTQSSANAAPRPPASPWKQLPLPASFAGAFLFVCIRRRSRRMLTASLALGLVLALSLSGLALTGCGGGTTTTTTNTTTNTPAGTYTIIITGTDSKTATTTNSATFTFTVS